MEILLWLLLVLVFDCVRRSPQGKRRADLAALTVILAVAYFASQGL